ncbi:RNA polymerase sigma factor [Dinghuibacter silviterrae]|nr:sigma-70 family RNA polymerase sigma factor [Dinghuibacter silviterrae]
MQTGQTDAELIHRIRKGEHTLFACLVERYQSYVFTLVLRQMGNREDAEEVAQDVFVKAYRSLADFRGDARFSTWLYTIVKTSCATFLRRKRPVINSLDKVELAADTQNPAETRSRHDALNRAIRLLSPEDAQVLTLFYQGEQTLEEIGRIMGLETNTVKVRLHRARHRLREVIEKHYRRESIN